MLKIIKFNVSLMDRCFIITYGLLVPAMDFSNH